MIKIGLIGCGIVTQKAHIPALVRDSRFSIEALCRRNQEKLEPLIQKFPQASFFGDYKKMIDSSNLDCVLIATDVDNHLEISEYAVKKGLYVLVEKPVDSKSDNIRNFSEMNSSDLSKIMVAFNKRFYPSMFKFEEYKKQKKFSKIIGGNIIFATQQGGKPGKAGILQNLIHTCDLVCHIFGKPLNVHSFFSEVLNDSTDGKTISSSIITDQGCSVSLFFTSSSNWKLPSHERIEIYDDRKSRIIIEDCDKIMLSKLDKEQKPDGWGNFPIINQYSKQSNSIFFRDSSFGYEQQINSFGDMIQETLNFKVPDLISALDAQILFEKLFEEEIRE